jgi:HPt (histidine-containing phosphotransfer) domain-containing protein
LAHIKRARPSSAARLAHTLKGSARGIGAWKATAAAEEFELAAQESDFEKLARNFEQLGRAILEARAAIRVLLAAPKQLGPAGMSRCHAVLLWRPSL